VGARSGRRCRYGIAADDERAESPAAVSYVRYFSPCSSLNLPCKIDSNRRDEPLSAAWRGVADRRVAAEKAEVRCVNRR
jgi:hypothetical protein